MAKSNAERQAAYRARHARGRTEARATTDMPDVAAIESMPSAKRWNALVEKGRALIEAARDEAEDYAADRSEAWQEGERGEAHTERVGVVAYRPKRHPLRRSGRDIIGTEARLELPRWRTVALAEG